MEKYREQLLKLVDRMDTQVSVRLAVCLLPGIIAVQFVRKMGLPQPGSIAAALLLLVGAFLYSQWARVRGQGTAENAETPVDQPAADPVRPATSSMQELIALYGDQARAEQAAMVEAQTNAGLTWNEAVEQALRRKRVVDRISTHPSGN